MARTFECPHCGADVPVGARSCPVCGSDEETGWSDAADYGHLLPTDDEDELPIVGTSAVPWLPFLIGVSALVVVAVVLSREQLILPILLLAALAAALLARRSRAVGPTDRETALYQRLLARARGDSALADRLVAHEAQRNPAGSRAQHLQSALDRWERDAR